MGEHFKRFLVSSWQGDLYGNAHEFTRGTIWLYLLAASFPWGLIAVAAFGVSRWRRQPAQQEWLSLEKGVGGLILASALSPAIFFTLSGNILWTYVLPGLPFLAVLASSLWPKELCGRMPASSLAAVLMIPMLGIAAAGWLSLHPEQLKTERDLVAQVEQLPGMSADNLFYLGKAPFSARFYSRGEAHAVEQTTVIDRLESSNLEKPMALAVEKGNKAMLRRLEGVTTPIAENRRFQLFLLTPSATTNANSFQDKSKNGGIDYNASNDHPLS